MGWEIKICKEAQKDYYKIDNSIRKQVLAAMIYEKYGDSVFKDIFENLKL